eukprot:TRINITY_DN30220_c0_g1_i1.p1 TRINITY_DN30220_c0_g1~~TRINITY_DN30220_c0_g1_i1.p1  ORF type:complete len:279 (+),score=68.61 TRINITY_DN30220_c0_g1_i1:41-877(+)
MSPCFLDFPAGHVLADAASATGGGVFKAARPVDAPGRRQGGSRAALLQRRAASNAHDSAEGIAEARDAVASPARRALLALSLVGACFLAPQRARALRRPRKCQTLEECIEIGDARAEQDEKDKGPIKYIGQGRDRLRFREIRPGIGDRAIKAGDDVDITYEVRKTDGDYIYSLGRGRLDMQMAEGGQDDFGETIRVKVGQQDVPIAVERIMEGMKPGGVRAVEMPPWLGFPTSDWKPEPVKSWAKQRMDRFRALLTGNGLQKGYDAMIVFEVEIVRIK